MASIMFKIGGINNGCDITITLPEINYTLPIFSPPFT